MKLPKRLIPILIAVVVIGAAAYAWSVLRQHGPGDRFVSGNGRVEATDIDVATKYPGRVQDILVAEGEFVKAGQVLAHMQVQSLQAQREEAEAHRQQAVPQAVP